MPINPVREESILAFDRASVRTINPKDGRLHVAVTPISKANICPYRGREIPKWRALGLDPDKLYQLLRDPEELKKAADTFNNIPLLDRHIPMNAWDHKSQYVIGSTGTDGEFDDPFLNNSLVVWVGKSIELIESNKKKELSSAYYYDADMTPGVYKGTRYDGVMRNLRGNHVALVESGRAGDDVMVGDSMENIMKPKPLSRTALLLRGALLAYMVPKMALDQKLDLTPVVTGVTAKNFKAEKEKIALRLVKAIEEVEMAQDASLDVEDVGKLLDILDTTGEIKEGMDAETVTAPSAAPVKPKKEDVAAPKPVIKAAKDGEVDDKEKPAKDEGPDLAGLCAFLKDKLPPEQYAEAESMIGAIPAADEPAEFPGKPKLDEKKPAEDEEDEEDDKVSKTAMDEALKTHGDAVEKRVMKTQRELAVARETIIPYVGKIDTMAFDSAEGVYRHTLTLLEVDNAETLPAAALLPILKAQPLASKRPTPMAMDAAAGGVKDDFAKRHPNAAAVRQA